MGWSVESRIDAAVSGLHQFYFYFLSAFNDFARGPGILLEGAFQKKVKHVIQDQKGVKVCINASLTRA